MHKVRIPSSTKILRNILQGFLFASCKTLPTVLALCSLLPSAISTPVQPRMQVGIVQDFHQQSKDMACIVELLYFEALNQSKEGMKAVITVVLNRKQAKGFPGSICGVVQQANQFSYRRSVGRGVVIKPQPKNPADKLALLKIQSLSRSVVQGTFKPNLPKDVLWYTKHSVKKPWMKKMVIVSKIDSHKFMKEI